MPLKDGILNNKPKSSSLWQHPPFVVRVLSHGATFSRKFVARLLRAGIDPGTPERIDLNGQKVNLYHVALLNRHQIAVLRRLVDSFDKAEFADDHTSQDLP